MARPKSDDPMMQKIGVRFTDEEMELLNAYSEKYNLARAQVLRKGLHILLEMDKDQDAKKA